MLLNRRALDFLVATSFAARLVRIRSRVGFSKEQLASKTEVGNRVTSRSTGPREAKWVASTPLSMRNVLGGVRFAVVLLALEVSSKELAGHR